LILTRHFCATMGYVMSEFFSMLYVLFTKSAMLYM
jgi:hypothetical protein